MMDAELTLLCISSGTSIDGHIYPTGSAEQWKDVFIPKYNMIKYDTSILRAFLCKDRNVGSTGVLYIEVPLFRQNSRDIT